MAEKKRGREMKENPYRGLTPKSGLEQTRWLFSGQQSRNTVTLALRAIKGGGTLVVQ